MNKIAPRQLFFFLACVAPVGKIVLLPTQLAYYSQNDLLFPLVVNFLIQAGVIFLIMLLARSNKTFYDLLAFTFGRIVAKILICIFAAFLFFAAFLPLLEQKLFVQSVFYDTLPSVVAFSSFFLFSAYLCAKPIAGLGRVWDILAPLAIAGIAGLLVIATPNADFEALSPAGAAGWNGFLSGTGYTWGWFYDSALVLMLMGRFEYRKGMAWKSLLCYLAGAAVVVFFFAVFYGVYSDIAVRQIFAFAKIGKYTSGVSVLGRVDYLFVFALTLVMAFYVAMPVQLGISCLVQTFGSGKYKPGIFSAAVNLIFLILSIAFDYLFSAISDTFNQTLFWIFPVFCVLVPLLALLLRRRPRAKV